MTARLQVSEQSGSGHHLAQLNIGRLIAPTDDPRVAEFMAALDRVNGLGNRMAAE